MILDQFNLKGKIALVTGASRGLGQAMALGLAEAGADIACVSRTGNDRQTRERVETLGRRFLGLQANLARPGPARRAGRSGGGSTSARSTSWSTTPAAARAIRRRSIPMTEWRETIEVHLNAAFDLSQQAARHMLPRRQGQDHQHRLDHVRRSGPEHPRLRRRQARHRRPDEVAGGRLGRARASTSTASRPGYFETDMATTLKNDPVRGPQILDRIPLGRWGQPAELAGLCVFLASDAAQYMHGSIVVIDGGWLAR